MPTFRCRRTIAPLAAALLLAPAAAGAQPLLEPEVERSTWSVEVQAGGWWRRGDPAAAGRTADGMGAFGAARLRYGMWPRLRLTMTGGYGTRPDRWREMVELPAGPLVLREHRDEIALLTAGAEWEALAGPTSLWLGLEGGLGWDRRPPTGGPGEPPSYPYPVRESLHFPEYSVLVVPSVTVRHRLTARFDVALSTWLPDGGRFELTGTPFVLAGLTWRP